MEEDQVQSDHQEFRKAEPMQAADSGNSNLKNGSSKPLLLILGIIILVAIGAAAYLLRGKLTGNTPSEEPSPPASAEIEISSPSPTPSFDRSKYTVRVLNGTKTSGLAGTASAKLKDLGYTIDKTGNATNSAFTKTLVRVKKTSSGLLEQLIKDLSSDYSAEESVSLKDSDTVDAEIILGSK